MSILEIIMIGYLVYITISHMLMTFLTWRGYFKYEVPTWNESNSFSVSIISPAYEEEECIVSSTHSLLNQTYDNFNVIVVNDGSTDNSLNKLKSEFNLTKIDYISDLNTEDIKHEKIIDVWKSDNLTVINKENGGKHDALNCGILNSSSDYILCVDADTYLEDYSVERLVKIKRDDVSAISAGIGIINDSVLKNGKLVEKKISNKYWIISQMVEYLRSFVSLRTSTDDLNGVMVISGACGFFNRNSVISVGGYEDSIVEDANLTLKLQESGKKIQFVSELLAYTEAPESLSQLHSQRMRWIRGMIGELFRFKHLIKEKTFIGRFMIPYSFFTDILGVWIELSAMFVFIMSISIGSINWVTFFIIFAYILTLYTINTLSLFYVASKKLDGCMDYNGKLKLVFIGLLEFTLYRPLLAFFVIKSQFLELFKFKKNWGKLKRKGF